MHTNQRVQASLNVSSNIQGGVFIITMITFMVFSHCISNVSSDGLQFSRIAAPSLSTFTHQLLQHSIHPFLLICVHFPIQLLGLPLHCLFHVYLVLQLLVGLLFCFLVQLPLLFRIKTLPMILVCLVMVEQVLYDFVD